MEISDSTRDLILKGKREATRYGTEMCPKCGNIRSPFFCFSCWADSVMESYKARLNEEKDGDK